VKLISLDAVIAISDCSRRTWRQRISQNPELKSCNDSKGRTMLSLDSVSDFLSIPPEPGGLELILCADSGDADAQNDAGLLFFDLDNKKAAFYWWLAAAAQCHRDAMHLLGQCYAAGMGVPADKNIGIMWIAKAAAGGHLIALEQVKGLRRFAV